jgi:hypothetical protein
MVALVTTAAAQTGESGRKDSAGCPITDMGSEMTVEAFWLQTQPTEGAARFTLVRSRIRP